MGGGAGHHMNGAGSGPPADAARSWEATFYAATLQEK
jgi:hypothetical protein